MEYLAYGLKYDVSSQIADRFSNTVEAQVVARIQSPVWFRVSTHILNRIWLQIRYPPNAEMF